jgi:hypothetical protein
MPKEKAIQHNGQKKRPDNTMAKRKGQTTQWPKEKARRSVGYISMNTTDHGNV